MAQYLKDEVQRAIAEAALRVFADKGFSRATMAEVGARARVSTGNIYRYYESKEALYQALIPDDFVATLRSLLRRRVEALGGVDDVRELEPEATYHVLSRELLAFTVENRLRVIILLARSEGTEHEGFADETVRSLVKLAVGHFRARDPSLRIDDAARRVLERIYRNLVVAMVDILAAFEDEARIRQAVEAYSRYHLAGLKALFG